MSISVTFTYTYKDQPAEPTGLFIDYNGNISGSGDNIVIRGGYQSDSATKTNYYETGFYMTEGQVVALKSILRARAKTNDRQLIESENNALQDMCTAIYRNFC